MSTDRQADIAEREAADDNQKYRNRYLGGWPSHVKDTEGEWAFRLNGRTFESLVPRT